MPATKNRQLNSIFERIVRDKNGVLVRVRFTVVEIDGKLQGQIISALPVSVIPVKTGIQSRFLLPGFSTKNSVSISKTFTSKILSPYFSLTFLMSQQTRAPAK